MSTNQTILDGIAALKQAAADNATAVTGEIAKLDAIIAALKNAGTGLTQAQIDQAVSDLQGISTVLAGTTATANTAT